MRKKLLPILLLALGINSCSNDDSDKPDENPEIYRYWQYSEPDQNKKITQNFIKFSNEEGGYVERHVRCQLEGKQVDESIKAPAEISNNRIVITKSVQSKIESCKIAIEKGEINYGIEENHLYLEDEKSKKVQKLIKGKMLRNACVRPNFQKLGDICVEAYNDYTTHTDDCPQKKLTCPKPDLVKHCPSVYKENDVYLYKGWEKVSCEELTEIFKNSSFGESKNISFNFFLEKNR